jgi:Tannase and feruloyl esterase
MRHLSAKLALTVLALSLTLALAPCAPARAQTIPNCTETNLQSLANSLAYPVTITAATPEYVPSTTIAFCDVTGDITTPGTNTIEFELGLPVLFNTNFLFIGGGGFNGYIPTGVVDPGVEAGFATAYTDSGHESVFASTPYAGLSALDGSWALDNTAAQEDFSYLGVHATTVIAQSITTGYYDSSSLTSYFDGCSTGGREALVEAQKFPDDYNGIIAGDPAISDPIAGFNWNDEALLSSAASYLPESAVNILDAAVTEACDGSDGVIDGLIEDPRLCKFDPASIECKGGNTSNCLTAAQVATVKAIRRGAHAEDGTQLYPGFSLSNPGGPDGWIAWITGDSVDYPPTFGVAEPWGNPPASLAIAPLQWSFQDQFLKYFVFNSPTYDSLTFDFNGSDVAMLENVVKMYGGNGENPDLSPFFNNGGKLIMYHGWSDPALTPFVSVDYYRAVAKRLGGGFKHLQRDARLFMVPGMHHCGGGPGPNLFNPLPQLMEWVEGGPAPDEIVATHCVNNDTSSCVVERTMPLCPYPQIASYIGGPIEVASSWICKKHINHRFYKGHHPQP